MKTLTLILSILMIATTAWSEPFMTSDPDPAAQVFQCEIDGVLDEMVYPVVDQSVMYDLALVAPGAHQMRCKFGTQWIDNGQPVPIYKWSEEWSALRPFGSPAPAGGPTLT